MVVSTSSYHPPSRSPSAPPGWAGVQLRQPQAALVVPEGTARGFEAVVAHRPFGHKIAPRLSQSGPLALHLSRAARGRTMRKTVIEPARS